MFTYRANAAAAVALVEQLHASGDASAHGVQLDLTDDAATRHAVDAVAIDGLHTVVYAAGPHVPMVHLSTVTPRAVPRSARVRRAGVFNLVHPALPHLRASAGNIVAVTTAATTRFPVRDGCRPHRRGRWRRCPRTGSGGGTLIMWDTARHARRHARRPPGLCEALEWMPALCPMEHPRDDGADLFPSASVVARCASKRARSSGIMGNVRPSRFFVVPASSVTTPARKSTCRHRSGRISLLSRQPVR